MLKGTTQVPIGNIEQYIHQLKEKMQETQVIVKHNLDVAQVQQKALYDTQKAHALHPLAEGDLVWLMNKTPPKVGQSSKFHLKWLSPYTIIKQTSPINYLIDGHLGTEKNVHIQRL